MQATFLDKEQLLWVQRTPLLPPTRPPSLPPRGVAFAGVPCFFGVAARVAATSDPPWVHSLSDDDPLGQGGVRVLLDPLLQASG
jgi:hypothetical protein